MTSELKILHVPLDVSGQMGTLSRAQQKLGSYSRSCNYINDLYKYRCDESLNLEQLNNVFQKSFRINKFFIEAISKFSVFHFHFGESMLPWHFDLPILKFLGKKMVMHYWGSDVRQLSIARRKNKYVRVKLDNEKHIINRIKHIAKYIKTAIVEDYELIEYIHDYFNRVAVIRQAVDLEKFIPIFPSKDCIKPIIVHAPTDSNLKGTEYVIAAIDKLKGEYPLEFILIQGISHEQATSIYKKADIIIDQLLIGSYGIFATEAMALGKPVICYIRDDLKSTYPEDLPIVSANPDNIYEELKILVGNPELRENLGFRGRNYVEKYHDSLLIARQLLDLYISL